MATKKTQTNQASPALRGSGKRYDAMRRSPGPKRATFIDCGEIALEAIDAVIDEGDAIIISRTSDGGAIAVTILTGQDRVKEYAGDQLELDRIIDVLKSQ